MTSKTSKDLHAEADRLKREALALEHTEKVAILQGQLQDMIPRLGLLSSDSLYAIGQRIASVSMDVDRLCAGKKTVAQEERAGYEQAAARAGNGVWE